MAQDLVSFLQQNPVDEIVQQVSVPGRLAKFKFKVRPMNQKQFNAYQRISTTFAQGKNKETKFDSGKFNELVIINQVVEPNFKDANLLSAAGVTTPEQYLNKFFLAGELGNLVEEICVLSGFVTPDAQLEEEVKNSWTAGIETPGTPITAGVNITDSQANI